MKIGTRIRTFAPDGSTVEGVTVSEPDKNGLMKIALGEKQNIVVRNVKRVTVIA